MVVDFTIINLKGCSMKKLLAISLACAVLPFYATEKPYQLQLSTKAVRITDMLTPLDDEYSPQAVGILLRYSSKAFKKTDIVIIDVQNKKVTKQGKLDSLTSDNINDIARGYACYHPCTKKSLAANGMNIGTIAIDRSIISSKKQDEYLMEERDAILAAALQRKTEKKKNKEVHAALDETMYGYDGPTILSDEKF